MIISDVPEGLTCPHCGEVKYILTLLSGNSLGGKIWSDSRRIYPMMLRPSSIQRCPHCGKYFHILDCSHKPADIPSHIFELRKPEESQAEKTPEELARKQREEKIRQEGYDNRFGELNYMEFIEAEPYIVTENATQERIIDYKLLYIYAYNDAKYGRFISEREDIPVFYQQKFKEFAMDVIESYGEDEILSAELWRELGRFEQCIRNCEHLLEIGVDEGVVKQIMEKAKNQDADAFILRFDEE